MDLPTKLFVAVMVLPVAAVVYAFVVQLASYAS
jgi:hypothetical protein